MSPDGQARAAHAVLSIPFFTQIIGGIEKTAVDARQYAGRELA